MSQLIEHAAVIVDSAKRRNFANTTASHFDFSVEPAITFNPKNKYFAKFINIEFPTSFPQIDSTNNTFIVEETNGVTPLLNTATVPNGSYLANELYTEIESQLDANTNYTMDYTINVSDITGKVSISFTGGGTGMTIKGTGTINQALGFATDDSAEIADSVILVSPNHIKLKFKRYAVIKSDLASDTFHTSTGNEPVIVHIPLSQGRSTIERLDGNNHSAPFIRINNVQSISKITFTSIDNLDNELDFQGGEWSGVLQFYKKTNRIRLES